MFSRVYYNPPLYQLSYLEWMTRVAGHMRGVGIEPTRIAPLDLKTNSITTRTSPLFRDVPVTKEFGHSPLLLHQLLLF